MTANDTIKTKYPKLSKKQKQIANYFIENEEEISYKTLKGISIDVGVTEVTVINFCRAVGYKNFVELKKQYRKEALNKLSPSKKLFQSVSEEIKLNDLSIKIIDQQLKCHRRALCRLREPELEKAVSLISEARKIYILGVGLSKVVCEYLKIRLDNLTMETEIVDLSKINALFFIRTLKFTEDDLYICVSYPRYSQVVIKLMKHFKARNYKVIAITDKESSPLVNNSSITFICDNESMFFYNSIQSAISLVDILSTLTYSKLKDKLLSVQKEVENMEEEFIDFSE
ncbi:MurR/RpiR family transcriptional regulator [Anaeropeptidivorans aminofermentans]|uniref:MurR/RpiR family transcriptional regulator n=1 Tax=Anaeropeptidivorans aminofermentans TaxID=2934315 RepID=UPI002025695B|nr:MurR/RpiR family transcriptional regulator [Anaeropeptidivorans aminofermentans]MBE6013222.1 MurR/RpiR family transcriptional regulator [Lachnospiraceae bacterium]